ncbi:unnamed protein product [Closterium sp. NIES-54]
MAQGGINSPSRDSILEFCWSSLLASSSNLVPPSSSHRSAPADAPATVPPVALDPPASKRLRTCSSSTDDHASMAGDGIPSASILKIEADFRMRGEEHSGVDFPSHAPQETADSQCRLLLLPGELLSSIVARVAASASCPGDIANLRLSCRTMRATAHAPATLAVASSAAVEVRLRQWCPHAHQFLQECCEAGNAPACHFLGMVSFYCLDLHELGMQLLARAAMAGHAPALYSLAVMHFNASRPLAPRPRDLPTAVQLCMRAASACYVPALRELAHCLQDGCGVPHDPLTAHHLLAQANHLEASQRVAAAAAASPAAAGTALQGDKSTSLHGSAASTPASVAGPVAASTATRVLLSEIASAEGPDALMLVQAEPAKGSRAHASSSLEPKHWPSVGGGRLGSAVDLRSSGLVPVGSRVRGAREGSMEGEQGRMCPMVSFAGAKDLEEEDWQERQVREVEEVEEGWMRGEEWEVLGSPTASELLELQVAEDRCPTDATHRFLVDWHAAAAAAAAATGADKCAVMMRGGPVQWGVAARDAAAAAGRGGGGGRCEVAEEMGMDVAATMVGGEQEGARAESSSCKRVCTSSSSTRSGGGRGGGGGGGGAMRMGASSGAARLEECGDLCREASAGVGLDVLVRPAVALPSSQHGGAAAQLAAPDFMSHAGTAVAAAAGAAAEALAEATAEAADELPTAESRPGPLHSSVLFLSHLHSLTPLQACSNPMCGRKESRPEEFRCCAACGEARYCSRACQAEDWAGGHQVACTMLAAAVMAVTESESAPLRMSSLVE